MPSSDSHRYFVLYLDTCSNYMWYFSISLKSDVFAIFIQFQCMDKRQFSTKIKCIQTYWDCEFHKLNKFFTKCVIVHRLE